MMRTTILVTALLVSMLSASAVYAQRVETTLLDGLHPVIDCNGMSSLACTITSKGNTMVALKTGVANTTVYKRFAVHKSDNSNPIPWTTAFTVCSGLGNSWRLPTQRELMLIWVLKVELEKATSINFSSLNYWSATEYDEGNSWYVNFINGDTPTNGSKSNSYTLRCIKEI